MRSAATDTHLKTRERGTMDHKEQHHQKHEKEREHEKKEHKAHAHQGKKNLLPFHPAWLFGVGAALALAAVLIWTLFLS
jgi:hypothetical protein